MHQGCVIRSSTGYVTFIVDEEKADGVFVHPLGESIFLSEYISHMKGTLVQVHVSAKNIENHQK